MIHSPAPCPNITTTPWPMTLTWTLRPSLNPQTDFWRCKDQPKYPHFSSKMKILVLVVLQLQEHTQIHTPLKTPLVHNSYRAVIHQRSFIRAQSQPLIKHPTDFWSPPEPLNPSGPCPSRYHRLGTMLAASKAWRVSSLMVRFSLFLPERSEYFKEVECSLVWGCFVGEAEAARAEAAPSKAEGKQAAASSIQELNYEESCLVTHHWGCAAAMHFLPRPPQEKWNKDYW